MINKIKLVKITYIIALILLILSIMFLITSNFILLHFFEKSYSDAKKYILWAIISQTFQGFYLLFVNYILFSKKTKLLASITFSCSLLQVVLSFFLIKHLGAIGGAYSTVIVSFINFLIVALVSQKVYSMPWFKVLTELKSFFKEPKFVQ